MTSNKILFLVNQSRLRWIGINRFIEDVRLDSRFVVVDLSFDGWSDFLLAVRKSSSIVLLGNFGYHRVTNENYSKSLKYDDDLIKEIENSGLPFVWYLMQDLHNYPHNLFFGRKRIENKEDAKEQAEVMAQIIPLIDALAWGYEEGIFEQIVPIEKDAWMDEFPNPNLAMDFFKGTFSQRISLPWAMSQSEIKNPDWKSKFTWDFAVPGWPYKSRQISENMLERAGLRKAPYSPYIEFANRLIPFATIFRSDLGTNRIANSIRYRTMKNTLKRTKFSYLDGSAYGYFVRKFVEIPTFGSVIITRGIPALRKLGFEPNSHFIPIDFQSLDQLKSELDGSQKIFEDIRRNAFELVSEIHTNNSRLNQLYYCVASLIEGKFHSAKYENGRFFLNSTVEIK